MHGNLLFRGMGSGGFSKLSVRSELRWWWDGVVNDLFMGRCAYWLITCVFLLFDASEQYWDKGLYGGNHIVKTQRTNWVIVAMHICIATGGANKFDYSSWGTIIWVLLFGVIFSDVYLLSCTKRHSLIGFAWVRSESIVWMLVLALGWLIFDAYRQI